MLFNLKLVIKKHNTNKKQINRKLHRGMFFNGRPGLFYFGAPVNIIKNNHAGCVEVWQQLVKIPQGGFVPVIAIYKNQIE